MEIGDAITVIDLGNYKRSYQEVVPFEAEIYDITDGMYLWVRSKVTGKEYELYEDQIKWKK